MISIQLNQIGGVAPYVISICDTSNTNCYVVFEGTPTLPLTLNIPPQLSTADQFIINALDSQMCNYFQLISCVPPSQTPTTTRTPTPTASPSNCLCLAFENFTSSNLMVGYTRCDGVVINETSYSGTTLYYCGSNPTADPGVVVYVGNPCVDNTCPNPTQTPTSSLTPTPTPTPVTQTPTPTNTTTPTTTPTPTSTSADYKQFQDGDDFEFQDNIPYDFQAF